MAGERRLQIVNVLILLVIVGALILSFFYIFDSNIPGLDLSSENAIEGGGLSAPQITTQYLISLIGQLNAIRLDKTVTNRSDFESLVDYRSLINPEPKGVDNPFVGTVR